MWIEALCYFKIVVFGISLYIYIYIWSSHFYIILNKFMWLQVACVPTFRAYKLNNCCVFQICQSDIFNKLSNFILNFFTFSTFWPWEFHNFSTTQILINLLWFWPKGMVCTFVVVSTHPLNQNVMMHLGWYT